MKTIHTAPIEVLSPRPNGAFTSEPYEAGWADEILVMAYVREMSGPGPELTLSAQISVDGSRWFNHPATPLLMSSTGGYSLALTHFGNWLRLAGEVRGGPTDGSPACVLDLYWVLKG